MTMLCESSPRDFGKRYVRFMRWLGIRAFIRLGDKVIKFVVRQSSLVCSSNNKRQQVSVSDISSVF